MDRDNLVPNKIRHADYDAKQTHFMTCNGPHFLVVTAFDTSYEVGFLCATVNEAYCAQHGYGFRRELLSPEAMGSLAANRHLAWAKVALLRKLMNDSSFHFDYLVWIDADALVLNHAVRLETFVETAAGADLIIGEDMADTDLLNTGLMLFRRTSWCRELLRRWWEESEVRWHHEVCWDQTGLCRVLTRDGFGKEKPWYSWCGGLRHKRWQQIFVMDCGSFNFKYLNCCSFVFHAVGERELPLSFVRRLLPKAERIAAALSFLCHCWPPRSTSPRSEAAQRAVTAALAAKRERAPPLGWDIEQDSWLGKPLGSCAAKKLQSTHSLELQDLSCDVPVQLVQGTVQGTKTCTVRLWQLCSYISGHLPPFSPLSATSKKPWRLLNWSPWGLPLPGLDQLGAWPPEARHNIYK